MDEIESSADLPLFGPNDIWSGKREQLQEYLQTASLWMMLKRSGISDMVVIEDNLGRFIMGTCRDGGEVLLYEDVTTRPTLGQIAQCLYKKLEAFAGIGKRTQELAEQASHGIRAVLEKQRTASILDMLRTGIDGSGPFRSDVVVIPVDFNTDPRDQWLDRLLGQQNCNPRTKTTKEVTIRRDKPWVMERRRVEAEVLSMYLGEEHILGVQGHSTNPLVLRIVACRRKAGRSKTMPATLDEGVQQVPLETQHQILEQLMPESPYEYRLVITFSPREETGRKLIRIKRERCSLSEESGCDGKQLIDIRAIVKDWIDTHTVFLWVRRIGNSEIEFDLWRTEEEELEETEE